MDIVVAGGLTVQNVVQGGTVFSMSWLVFFPQLNRYSNIKSGEKHTQESIRSKKPKLLQQEPSLDHPIRKQKAMFRVFLAWVIDALIDR